MWCHAGKCVAYMYSRSSSLGAFSPTTKKQIGKVGCYRQGVGPKGAGELLTKHGNKPKLAIHAQFKLDTENSKTIW